MLGRKMREEQEGEHQELQDLDPRGSPHLEEKVIGGNVDLDLLSLFPQDLARIIGGIESNQALRMSTMEVEQELNGWIRPRGKKTPFI